MGRPQWLRLQATDRATCQALTKPGSPGPGSVSGLLRDQALFPAGKQVTAEKGVLVGKHGQLSVSHTLSTQAPAGFVGLAFRGLCSHEGGAWPCAHNARMTACHDPGGSHVSSAGQGAAGRPREGRWKRCWMPGPQEAWGPCKALRRLPIIKVKAYYTLGRT